MDATEIKIAIIRAGVSQWRVARELGMSEATLSRWLRPGTVLPDDLEEKIIAAVDRLGAARAAR